MVNTAAVRNKLLVQCAGQAKPHHPELEPATRRSRTPTSQGAISLERTRGSSSPLYTKEYTLNYKGP